MYQRFSKCRAVECVCNPGRGVGGSRTTRQCGTLEEQSSLSQNSTRRCSCTVCPLEQFQLGDYGMQLPQALTVSDKTQTTKLQYCSKMSVCMEKNVLLARILFCDEAVFHSIRKVNKQNERILCIEEPREVVGYKCDCPVVSVCCQRCIGLQSSWNQGSSKWTGCKYNLMPQLQDHNDGTITLQQDGAVRIFYAAVHTVPDSVSGKWIGRAGPIPWTPFFKSDTCRFVTL